MESERQTDRLISCGSWGPSLPPPSAQLHTFHSFLCPMEKVTAKREETRGGSVSNQAALCPKSLQVCAYLPAP